MCQSCANTQGHVLFDWPTDLCDRARRSALADILSFVQDMFQGPMDHMADEITLTAAGARGVSLILGAVEQSLRFDVDQITPTPPSG